jgi:hypothetical protein
VLSTLRSKLSYANAMATLAVFIALAGTSVAAVTLKRNSVRSKHIAKGQVKRSDIGRSAVTSTKVANNSLRLIDFKAGQIPAGPPGTPGQPGSPAASMLMGTVPFLVNSENANGTFAFPPVGEADNAGGAMLSPNQTVVLRDLAVSVPTAPGAGASRTAYLGILGSTLPPEAAISCSVSGAETICTSGDATLTVPPASLLTFALRNGAVAPANSSVEFGYRATTP